MNMNNRMKIFFFILVFSFVCSSCEKDQDAMLTQLEVMKEQFTPSYTSIAVECQLNTSASIKDVYVQYAASEKFADYQEIQMLKKDGKYSANITDLEDNTTYYIRYSASNRYSSMVTKEITSTKTLVPSVPEIQILSITNVLDKSADVLFDLRFDGGAAITQLGICWGTSNKPSLDSDHFVDTKDNKTIVSVSTLQENTTYYVRAYAKNKVGIAYSESTAFTTLTLPKVQTNDISSVQLTSAMLNALLLFNGNDSTITKGFCWSESTNPTLSSSHIEVNVATPSYTYQLSNLKDETQYYVRAYAKNKIGIVYGNEKTFTTLSATKPVVTTSSASKISYTSVTVGGNVTSDGGATVTERGICYSKSSSPTLSDSKFVSGSGIGTYTTNLTGLLDGTTYYVRAYAINKKGVTYGEQKSFTTKSYTLPTVTTSSATNITYTSAAVGGSVTSDGGTSITECGVVYSTSQNPTTSNGKVNWGSGTGSFSCSLSNLQSATTYYARAYAINKKGTAYGEQKSFTTKSYALPTVATLSATNITYTSATVGGNVINEGGANVTERGIVYSIIPNPTTSNDKVICGSGIGSFSCPLNNLRNGTTYYARAYAINAGGISYGEEISFTLQKYTLPEFDFTARYDFYSSSGQAYVECTITIINDGGTAITEIGVEYDKNIWWESNKCVKFNVNRDQSVYTTNIPYRDYVTNGNWTYYRGYVVNALGKKTSEYVWVGQ